MVNQASEAEQYPLPKPEDLYTSLAGSKTFTKLGLSHAYQQLPFDKESKYISKGDGHQFAGNPTCHVLHWQHFGHRSWWPDSSAQFGHGPSTLGHWVRLNKGKHSFLESSVDYLGQWIDAKGVHAMEDKVEALLQVPTPANLQDFIPFLAF